MCFLEVPTYPRLVRESLVESMVKSTLIILDERRIRSILEMPRAGTCVPRIEKKIDGLKCILEREDVNEMVNFFALNCSWR